MLDKEILDNVEKLLLSKKTDFIQTGFQDLDYFLKGINSSALITIGARPSMGKTAFLITLLINFLRQKKKCLFLSLEMSAEMIVMRMISQMTEISRIRLGDGDLKEKDFEKINEAINELRDFDLKLSAERFDIKSIEEQMENKKPDFVFIDYLQLIDSNSSKTRTEIISDSLRKLKQAARDNNCIVFISSQLSRRLEDRYDKRPMLSDIRDCGDIENISDVVLFLFREEYYDAENPMLKAKADIIVAKNKYGCCGTIHTLFKRETVKFMEKFRYEKE